MSVHLNVCLPALVWKVRCEKGVTPASTNRILMFIKNPRVWVLKHFPAAKYRGENFFYYAWFVNYHITLSMKMEAIFNVYQNHNIVVWIYTYGYGEFLIFSFVYYCGTIKQYFLLYLHHSSCNFSTITFAEPLWRKHVIF